MTASTEEFSTIIGPDAVFKGELQFEKGVQLLGRMEGAVLSGGNLVIGEGAKLLGDAKAGTIRLDGEVKGNLVAATKVTLSASAKLEGDLQTARLEVAEGAVLVGRCQIGVNGTPGGNGATKQAPAASVAAPAGKGKSEEVRAGRR
jgi:cytoskeletal protein CcmA (bactofilin family)